MIEKSRGQELRVLILFPGKTDRKTYEPIVSGIEKQGIQYSLRLGSAHKSPELVREILEADFDLVISGAGLSAALPGVIASETLVPVLGVPCPGAYGGLDSFLSIVQMPPGVPVLCVKAEHVSEEAVKILKVMESGVKKINIAGAGESAKKAFRTLEETGVDFARSDSCSDAINIVFTPMGAPVEDSNHLIIYCPEAEVSSPEDAVRSMNESSSGLWVGLNRGENAAIAAVQITGNKEALTASRRTFEEKCRREDDEVRRR